MNAEDRALLLEIRDELHAIRRLVEPRTGGRGPRDGEDIRLLVQMAEATEGRAFTAGALLEHARLVAPTLRAALLAADLTEANELGHWFGRMAGVPVSGFVLERGARGRGGRRWVVQVG